MTDGFSTPVKNPKEVLNIPPSPFLKRLGYGTGVTVYQFERSPKADKVRSPWALKIINSTHMKNTDFGKRLREEATLLKKMNHPNIVGFRAFTKTNLGECLAMETCTISLADLIEKRNEDGLLAFSGKNIMRMGQHISKALDYLHVRMLLLHGDIKSHNVLVINDFEICKLCDFGVSLPLTRNGDVDKIKAGDEVEYIGTPCWSAPEIIEDPFAKITTKVDIFAFGLVFWEMMALDIPHGSAISQDLDENSTLDDSFNENAVVFGTRPAIPYHMLGNNYEEYKYALEVFYCCTEKDPDDRPSAQHLALSIYEMINCDKLE